MEHSRDSLKPETGERMGESVGKWVSDRAMSAKDQALVIDIDRQTGSLGAKVPIYIQEEKL